MPLIFILTACRAEVRAPVSTFTFIFLVLNLGSLAHSRHPKEGLAVFIKSPKGFVVRVKTVTLLQTRDCDKKLKNFKIKGLLNFCKELRFFKNTFEKV
jgi:hypothetical protein